MNSHKQYFINRKLTYNSPLVYLTVHRGIPRQIPHIHSPKPRTRRCQGPAAMLLSTIITSDRCTCLSSSTLAQSPIPADWAAANGVNLSTYGAGCAAHDALRPTCTAPLPAECVSIVPTPRHCDVDRRWCNDAWCFVNAGDCDLEHRASEALPGRTFSYAACGFSDWSWMGEHQERSLVGKTVRVGFRSNTGGWTGAYNPDGNGARNNLWSGPTYDLLLAAASDGGFHINITEPPTALVQNARSSSSFTQCMYATALGYLDLCVGTMTMTNARVSASDFFFLDAAPVVAVSFRASQHTLATSMKQILSPLSGGAWALFFVTLLTITAIFAAQEFTLSGSMFEGLEAKHTTGNEKTNDGQDCTAAAEHTASAGHHAEQARVHHAEHTARTVMNHAEHTAVHHAEVTLAAA